LLLFSENVTLGFFPTDLFGMEILGAISNALANNNYDLLMAHIDPYDRTWAAHYLNTGRVDGFILMTSSRKPNHIHYLLESHAPFIRSYSFTGINRMTDRPGLFKFNTKDLAKQNVKDCNATQRMVE